MNPWLPQGFKAGTLLPRNVPDRIDTPNGRRYQTPFGVFPSVTTVLAATKPARDRAMLKRWQEKVGLEEAKRISSEALANGSSMHDAIERLIYHGEPLDLDDPWQRYVAPEVQLAFDAGIAVCESAVWHSAGFAGTVDLMTLECVEDWKTSAKKKKREWIEDYCVQISAYCAALREMYGNGCARKARIVVNYTTEKADAFTLEFPELVTYWNQFYKRLKSIKR